MSLNTKMKKLQESLNTIFELSEELDCNLMHNYKWREVIQKNTLDNIGIVVQDVPGITGDDFIADGITKGDYKSAKGKLLLSGKLSKSTGKFEFDKQNDPVRREDTLKYNGLFFTWFIGANPIASVLIKSKEAVQSYKKLASQKQKDFIKLMNESVEKGKRVSRDSISFNYKDIMAMTGLKYYKGEKEITRQEFENLFGGK